MYCSNCGNQIHENSKFCSDCGFQLSNNVTQNENKVKVPENNCSICNSKLRNVYKNENFENKQICPSCDLKPGICPICNSKLRTEKAEQCPNCQCSWRLNPPNSETPKFVILQKDKKVPENKNEVKCPKCGSTAIAANKKGFGLGKAIVGGVLTGGIGLLAGFLGSNKVKITCLNCGNEWRP